MFASTFGLLFQAAFHVLKNTLMPDGSKFPGAAVTSLRTPHEKGGVPAGTLGRSSPLLHPGVCEERPYVCHRSLRHVPRQPLCDAFSSDATTKAPAKKVGWR